ncbi:alpha/beta fold hydrolase [Actinosynnema sp. NPDC091369]
MRTIDSPDRARDLDALRRGLRVDAVDFYGVSYGTVTGQALVELFPGTVRSMVLDSPQLSRLSTRDYLLTAAAGTEDTAHGFAAWCQAHQAAPPGQGSCRALARVIGRSTPITAQQVLLHLGRLRLPAEAGRLRDAGGTPVTPDDLTNAFSFLYPGKDSPAWLEGQARTLAGWRPRQRDEIAPGTAGEPSADSQTLLRCNDFFDRTITTGDQWSELWRSSRGVAPIVRTSTRHWKWVRSCLGTDLGRWRPGPFPTTVPLLVVSMRYDSATPHVWARQLATAASAPLITFNGFGHGAYDAAIEHAPAGTASPGRSRTSSCAGSSRATCGARARRPFPALERTCEAPPRRKNREWDGRWGC